MKARKTYFRHLVPLAEEESFPLDFLLDEPMNSHQNTVRTQSQNDEVPLLWELDDEVAPVAEAARDHVQDDFDVDVLRVLDELV